MLKKVWTVERGMVVLNEDNSESCAWKNSFISHIGMPFTKTK